MNDCVFCNILAGQRPASVVFRDEVCCAFMDIQPINPGHVLVIPIAHAANLAQLDPKAGGRVFQVGQRVAQALRDSGLRCQGINFFLADGRIAGQEVFHVHLHVIPRYRGDGFGFRFGPGYGQQPPRAGLDQIASQIRQAL